MLYQLSYLGVAGTGQGRAERAGYRVSFSLCPYRRQRKIRLSPALSQIGLTPRAFAPVVHLNYAQAVLPVHDGLPKLKDFPTEAGASGETVPA